LETLEKVYRNPDCCTTALQEFRRLYQRNKDFNSFWAEFQYLVAEIDYSPETLIDELYNKVSVDLEYTIITETDPVDIYTLARKYQQYNINIQRLKARESRIPARNRTIPQVPVPVPASQERALAATTSSTANSVPCTTQLYIPITDQEKQKLQAENKYYYYKQEGYRFFEYPVKACTKLTAVNIVNTETKEDQGKESP
jgi:hypothetical protein